jgi:hypothetical protein
VKSFAAQAGFAVWLTFLVSVELVAWAAGDAQVVLGEKAGLVAKAGIVAYAGHFVYFGLAELVGQFAWAVLAEHIEPAA